jgi:SAM-dependent methyltransferase
MSATAPDPDAQRAAVRLRWEQSGTGWERIADHTREWSTPVSAAMVDGLGLRPGDRVLELAGGPGDTGFMAAELIAPGGTLISSDGAEAMLAIARERADAQGLTNVEFKRLELEWIDLPTGDVDAVLCRWGIMFAVDPNAAAREIRRVLRPGGHAAIAVWDTPALNPWSRAADAAMRELGHLPAPDPGAPGPFAIAGERAVRELLEGAGLLDVTVIAVELERRAPSFDVYLDELAAFVTPLGQALARLTDDDRARARAHIARALAPYTADDGSLAVPGRSCVAIAAG